MDTQGIIGWIDSHPRIGFGIAVAVIAVILVAYFSGKICFTKAKKSASKKAKPDSDEDQSLDELIDTIHSNQAN